MTVKKAMTKDNRKPLRNGMIGRELRDWYDVGIVEVKSGKLSVVDFGVFSRTDGVIVNVPKGAFRVSAKIMSFEGSLGICRARAVREPIANIKQGEVLGQVSVDAARIAIGDIVNAARRLDDEDREAVSERVRKSRDIYGELVTFDFKAGPVDLACIASGFGDGSYPVMALMNAGKTVGVEIEFVKDGHVYDRPGF